MKWLYMIISLFAINGTYAQYGQEGAILAASEGVIRALELDQLDNIAKAQERIVILHGLIAVTTADIVRIEQIKLDSETALQPWVNNLSSVVRIGLTATQLVELQGEILQLAQDVPEMLPFITESLALLIGDSVIIVQDFQIALKEGSSNLLDNKARMDIINASQDGLDYLVEKSLSLLILMESLSHMAFMESSIPGDFQVNYDAIIERTSEKIESLIVE